MAQKALRDGIVAINKPKGLTSNDLLNVVKNKLLQTSTAHQFGSNAITRRKRRRSANNCLKIGHGGTLDPLATGVLVIGLNKGTKAMAQYLAGPKTYETTLLFGTETDTYDAEGRIMGRCPTDHLTIDEIRRTIGKKFSDSSIKQTPPIYSALKMDGKPLYYYARNSIKLPKKIESRIHKCHIDVLEFSHEHEFNNPNDTITEEEYNFIKQYIDLPKSYSDAVSPPQQPIAVGPILKLRLTVTSGFYVRTLCHDIGRALSSAAHMVELKRTQQGIFGIDNGNVMPELAPDMDSFKWLQGFSSYVLNLEEVDAYNTRSKISHNMEVTEIREADSDIKKQKLVE